MGLALFDSKRCFPQIYADSPYCGPLVGQTAMGLDLFGSKRYSPN